MSSIPKSLPSGPRCEICRQPCRGDRKLYADGFTVVGKRNDRKIRKFFSMANQAIDFLRENLDKYHSIYMDIGQRYANHVVPQVWVVLRPSDKYWKVTSSELKSLADVHRTAYNRCVAALSGVRHHTHDTIYMVRVERLNGQKTAIKCFDMDSFIEIYYDCVGKVNVDQDLVSNCSDYSDPTEEVPLLTGYTEQSDDVPHYIAQLDAEYS